MPAGREREEASFPSTDWSEVEEAGGGSGPAAREALGELLVRYLPALRAHLVRRLRFTPDEAEDLLQGFIADKVVERGLVARADRRRGRFRTFLLAALENYVRSALRRRRAGKRLPADGKVVNATDHLDRLPSAEPDSRDFDAAWAREVLSETLRRMKRHCAENGREEVWAVFECRILLPTLGRADPVPYRHLLERFGFRSPTQASNVLITGKRMFRRFLRRVVGEYVAGEGEVEEEIEQLRRALAQTDA